MSRNLDAPPVPDDVVALCERIGFDPLRTPFNCHVASLALVLSGIYPGARVARGIARGVIGQHSWVVADGGCYDDSAHVIDLTLWSYDPTRVPGVWQGTYADNVHRPHGWGHVLTGTPPSHHGGETIHLSADPGDKARPFLRLLGAPFDAAGWMQVASLPVGGWPAREVIEAMLDTPALAALVPIDRAGMLTNRNPSNSYLHPDDVDPRFR